MLDLMGWFTQVTSPIRRYPDLLAHFQIKAALLNRTPPHSSSTLLAAVEKAAEVSKGNAKMEGAVRDHFLAAYFARKPKSVYAAEFLGVANAVRYSCKL